MFTLRDYQTDIAHRALAILQQYHMVYLALEPRVGKTVTALYAANAYGARKVLMLTKLKALSSIKSDFEKVAYLLRKDFSLYAINYEQAHTLSAKDYDLIICDEAHLMGAFPKPSERTKTVKALAEKKPIIYLSGTPSPESFSQLYHQFWISSFSPFGEWTNFYKWANDGFVKVKKKLINGVSINDYKQADKDKIDFYTKHLFISMTQAEAGFKQEIMEHILTVKMNKGTYWLANKLMRDRVHIGKNGEQVIADTAAKLSQKIHQVFSGTVLCEDGEAMVFDTSKADFIKSHFEGQKIAIFYKFKAEAIVLKWVFGERITEDVDEFRDSESRVWISQIQSGREGTNLSTADALIFFNIDFSHVSYLQARARLSTKDREKAANIYWVFAENGIEFKVMDKVKKKQDYNSAHFQRDYSAILQNNTKKAA